METQMTAYSDRRQKQAGGASLFIVIFAALMMVVITISFIQLMLSDQRQASVSDLSQSAFDSAQAGIEDGKRALLLRQSCGADTTSPQCMAVSSAFAAAPACNMVSRAIFGASAADTSETIVQKSGSSTDTLLNQAYTCVKITPDTDDYRAVIKDSDQSVVVPLKGQTSFSKVRISWFTSADAGGGKTATRPATVALPKVGTSWKPTTPPLLRAQLMQTNTSFTLDQFDDGASGSDASTLFLFPSPTGVDSLPSFASASGRKSTGGVAPSEVTCSTDLAANTYACKVTADLPLPVGGDAGSRTNAFLRLTALYNKANLKVELLDDGGNVVKFSGVQAIVDSTGRANDVYRRVEARVELGSDMAYPDAAISLKGDFCKNFTVTDQVNGYSSKCTP